MLGVVLVLKKIKIYINEEMIRGNFEGAKRQ